MMKKTLTLFISFLLGFSLNSSSAFGQSQAQLTAQFDRIISSELKPDEPGGVVLIAQKGKIIYKKAFGLANLELNAPMKEETVFNIASITKQFTAVAVLQLAEQGKLSLQDEITKYLPDYPAGGQKITIENLLTHTAGIPNSDIEALIKLQSGRSFVTLPQILDTFKTRPLDFAPGTKMVYSNNGYILLGAIVEKVSGISYPEYLEKNLFKPAEMLDSHFADDFKIIKNRASNYVYSPQDSRFFNTRGVKTEMAYSAGAIQSTADDMFRWNQALVAHKLIKKDSLKKAQTAYKLPNGKSAYYGYGWFVGNIQGSPIAEHGGNMGGFMSHAIYLPQEDVYVAVFYNFRDSARLPEFLAGDLAALSIGKPFNIKEIASDENTLKTYVGVYEEEGVERFITVGNGKLYYQRVGANKIQMKPYARDKFFLENTAVIAEFKRDASGVIVSLNLVNKRGISSNTLRKTDKSLPAAPK